MQNCPAAWITNFTFEFDFNASGTNPNVPTAAQVVRSGAAATGTLDFSGSNAKISGIAVTKHVVSETHEVAAIWTLEAESTAATHWGYTYSVTTV